MKRLLLILVTILITSPAFAKEMDFDDFARLPVQHEGRIKPLDTTARIYLKAFHGRENIDELDHKAWLAETLFNPAESMQRPLFRIFRPELLGLPEREKPFYSYVELATALQGVAGSLEKLRKTPPEEWSEDQQELAKLQDYSILYTQLLRSFSLVLPLGITPPPSLLKEWKIATDKNLTLQDIRKYQERLDKRVRKIIASKGSVPERYSEEERQIVAFAFEMQTLLAGGEHNVLLRIIPSSWDQKTGEWLSPWALTQQGKGSPQSASLLELWKEAAKAYEESDEEEWQGKVKQIHEVMKGHSSQSRLSAEIAYNQLSPLQGAMIFYLATFLIFAAWSMSGNKNWHKAAFLTLAGASLLNLSAVLMRVFILERPPVGTLYESILFVALICGVMGLGLEARRKDGNGILTGSIAAGLLLLLSQGFAEGDSLRMLVAVLNTNFWLGTHVLCITIGYGLCLITAGYAHLYLVRKARRNIQAEELTSPIKTMSLLALLFTAIGTILGGIWADQSWGRFWGWDPKENGALLIVLWLIWVLHGQISGHLKRVPYMVVTSLLAVVVALAWFGVNLLNVGLHSYGFITGVAGGLGAFCAAEFLLIGFLWFKIHKDKAAA